MEQEKTEVKKRLTLFVGLTFVITWIIFVLIPLRGLTYGRNNLLKHSKPWTLL